MPRRRSQSGSRQRRRSRSRRKDRGERRRGSEASGSEEAPHADEPDQPFRMEICRGRHEDPVPTFDISIPVEGGDDEETQVLPHVCANAGEGYVIRVTNASRRHVACAVSVDGDNALLKDGSLIVAPKDSRELLGFLVSKNFVGKEYVKEYRSFCFGRPKVVEGGASNPTAEEQPYTTYGRILCEVYEAVLDEEVDSDTELRGQTTFYRGAGVNGSNDERVVPEGKKKHFLYSSVTVHGPRAAISNSTRGRWWVRGTRRLRTLEIRYREPHSLMLLGVNPKALGVAQCKQESGDAKSEFKKEEEDDAKLDKKPGGPDSGLMEVCDLTADGEGSGAWSLHKTDRADAVEVERD